MKEGEVITRIDITFGNAVELVVKFFFASVIAIGLIGAFVGVIGAGVSAAIGK